jgi:hypothetical protein
LRLGIVTALTLPLLAWLTEVSVNASLSVLGFDAFGAGIELHGHLGMALLLGALWGAGAGAVGALLARATGAAGRRAAPLALTAVPAGAVAASPGQPQYAHEAGAGVPAEPGAQRGESGPYTPSASYRAPNPATNPYLQVPDELREPEDARPPSGDTARPGAQPSKQPREQPPRAPEEGAGMYGAPTVAGPVGGPPPRSWRRPPRPRPADRSQSAPGEPPPPPPPPPPPGRPKGRP